MYKTTWYIKNVEFTTELTWYHFGKEPKFPTKYMEEGITYEIEMIWNFRLVPTLRAFLKCLFHEYIVKLVN